MKYHLRLDGVILARYGSFWHAHVALLDDSAATGYPVERYEITECS